MAWCRVERKSRAADSTGSLRARLRLPVLSNSRLRVLGGGGFDPGPRPTSGVFPIDQARTLENFRVV